MGKPKSTSKVKLTNKSANKRNKPKQLKNTNKQLPLQQQQQQKQQQNVNKSAVNKSNEKRKKNEIYKKPPPVPVPVSDEELDDEDLAFSDDDMLEYVNDNVENLSFFNQSLSESNGSSKKKSKKLKEVETDEDYEREPRSFGKSTHDDDSNRMRLLPVKGDKGLIHRTRDVQDDGGSDDGEEDSNDEAEGMEEDAEEKEGEGEVSMVELLARHQAEVNRKKIKVAQLAQQTIENTDKVGNLKELLALCVRTQPVTVRKLALLSLMEVFKDIVPSYRIRELTEQEHAIKVSRDVCALREFENSLLTSYQKYLTLLEDNIKDILQLLKKQRKNPTKTTKVDDSVKALLNVAVVSTQCMCQLLQALPHFNYRSNIVEVLVPKIQLSGQLKQIGELCFDGVKGALIGDKVGDLSLDVVKCINKLVKSKPHVRAQVLDVLLHLRVNSEAIRAAEEKGNKMERLRKKREQINRMSRKEKKFKKFEDALNKEMQEAEAVESRDKLERVHTDVLNFLFVIYFRVLKNEELNPTLLPPVLKGLAKYSHLINVEFFNDLMAALQRILKMENVKLHESLNCIRTAMKILSGQGEILTIDPKQFSTELYCRLLYLAADSTKEDVSISKSCIEDLILKRRKQVSLVQVTGFFKRLGTVLLQMDAHYALDYMLLLRTLLQAHPKCDHLLDTDVCARGVFQPEVSDPEYCNAEATNLWELSLLRSHYDNQLDPVTTNVTLGAPSQGPNALSHKFINRQTKPTEEDGEEFLFPGHISGNPPSKKCRLNNKLTVWTNAGLQQMCAPDDSSLTITEAELENFSPAKRKRKKNEE